MQVRSIPVIVVIEITILVVIDVLVLRCENLLVPITIPFVVIVVRTAQLLLLPLLLRGGIDTSTAPLLLLLYRVANVVICSERQLTRVARS